MDDAVLLLDAGGLFPQGGFGPVVSESIYKIGIEAMRAAGYDAMNLAATDLQQGIAVVNSANANTHLPMVTSNIVFAGTRIPLEAPYLILDVNGVSVGLLSISAPDTLSKLPSSGLVDLLDIVPPAEALAQYLPMVRKKAQVVILLSSAGVEATDDFIHDIPGIDLVLVSGNTKSESLSCHDLEKLQSEGKALPEDLKVLPVTVKAQALGHASMELQPGKPAHVTAVEYIPMNSQVALDPEIVQMTGNDVYKDAVMALRARVEESRKQMEKEIQESLQLSPEEYFQKLQQEQKAGGVQ